MLLLIAAGCSGTTGPTGPQGPEGPQVVPGPRGEPGGVYIYVDADGKEVDTDHSRIWTDANGWQWMINIANATVNPTRSLDNMFFESTDCTGDAYVVVSGFVPNQPIVSNMPAGVVEYWVVTGDTVVESKILGSYVQTPSSPCATATPVRLDALRIVKVDGLTPPTLPYRAPLRLERRR